MKTTAFLCAILAIMCVPHAANAREPGLSQLYTVCMDKTGNTTASMTECMMAEIKRQDAQLNKAYKALMTDLLPSRKTQLQETQRIWMKYRDANCAFYFDPEGGTQARVNANECMMNTTAERARELENFRQ
jgi:uncharacterized protein YecT (DUF1311 family)